MNLMVMSARNPPEIKPGILSVNENQDYKGSSLIGRSVQS
jgi:hypothetical protein